MDGESKKIIEDCFLRPIADARSTNGTLEPPPTKAPVKVELQVLRLNDDSQKMVMDTLRYIHGDNFELDNINSYKDKGHRAKNGYWKDRGNLVIQGGCDYSNVQKTGSTTEDTFRMYAIMKLESYGFHKAHCTEALEHTKGEVNEALQLLFSKYFPLRVDGDNNVQPDIDYTENEILEMRQDEKAALESIYDNSFEEKEKNKVWQLKLKIDHLLIHSPSEKKKIDANQQSLQVIEKPTKKNIEPCRNFTRGKCKFGDRCRFSHNPPPQPDKSTEKLIDPNMDPNWFYLEIRFPEKNCYPFEAPLIFLKTTCPDIPHILCLKLTGFLVQEARKLAKDGMPSVYTISELLLLDDEIAKFLENDRTIFLHPKKSLFYVANGEEETKIIQQNLPSHYKKGSTGRSDRENLTLEQMLKEDLILARKFLEKQKNQQYQNMQIIRQNLPAWDKRDDILKLVNDSQVVVISGETGCGKSTQVPQFFLDDWLTKSFKISGNKMRHVEIICTQPRRLSAIGVAQRVSDERNERIGNTIGYQIRLENKISSSTRLTFCTTGILLRRLQSDPMLESVSHVLVDEVHERSEESDFLLLILKELLVKRPELKVILMSATLNASLFSNYFAKAPVLDIPGRTFPVEQIFLEDILEETKFVLEADSQYCRKLNKSEEKALMDELEYADVQAAKDPPAKSIRDENLKLSDIFARYSDYSKPTCKTLYLMDPMRINPELIEAILKYIVEGDHQWPREGSILIFLPGLAEIQTMYDSLCDSALFNPRAGKFILVPLHSTLTNEEQALVFQKAPQNKRKIVLSTNIAETSVTIDDCVFVIDCGQMKEKRFDSNRNMESLDLVWVSRANAQQRKGRAGRVMPGVAIHLYTHYRYSYHILSQPVPEIHRVPLEQLLLRIKVLPNFCDRNLMEVISNTLEPPIEENISAAVTRLRDIGALDDDQNLTSLGHHLAALPVDVRIGKLMLFGSIFQCLDSVLTIAACLSYKSPFVSPFSKKHEADNKKREFAICNSDHLTVLKAYKRWRDANKRSKYSGKCFADENFLSWRTLETLVEIKHQFLELLTSIGFVPIDLTGKKSRGLQDNIVELTGHEMNTNGENSRLLIAILCAALYPNVVKVLTPEKSFTMGIGGALPRQPLPNELRFKTREDGYVAIHPSSVNSTVGHFNTPFLIYQEKVKTSRIFIRDCTMVPLLPLVFFAGSDMKIELHGGDFVILLEDGWIMLQAASHQVAEMIKWLRKELLNILEEKIQDPCLNLLHHDNGSKVISTIVYLLSKEW